MKKIAFLSLTLIIIFSSCSASNKIHDHEENRADSNIKINENVVAEKLLKKKR
jgi:hypothetical protein